MNVTLPLLDSILRFYGYVCSNESFMRTLILFRFPNDVTEDFPKPGIALSL
jgi:hypothetical protein